MGMHGRSSTGDGMGIHGQSSTQVGMDMQSMHGQLDDQTGREESEVCAELEMRKQGDR